MVASTLISSLQYGQVARLSIFLEPCVIETTIMIPTKGDKKKDNQKKAALDLLF
jgi:hypothetical protein